MPASARCSNETTKAAHAASAYHQRLRHLKVQDLSGVGTGASDSYGNC